MERENLISRNLTRAGLLILVVLTMIWVPEPASALQPLTVENVLEPTPPGNQPGSPMYVQATVTGDGSGTVVFYLGENSSPGPDDVEIASTSVALSGGSSTVGVAGTIPLGVAPGLYYVLACAADECAATAQTIYIIGEGLSPIDQTPENQMTVGWPPLGVGFYPESTPGMSVSSPFDCPSNKHGQSGGKCVWVMTPKLPWYLYETFEPFYCPANQPFPFLVQIGFDTLWEDKSSIGYAALTRPNSFTKNKRDFFGPFSYAGNSSTDPGYAMFRWICFRNAVTNCGGFFSEKVFAQVRYICADKKTNAAYP